MEIEIINWTTLFVVLSPLFVAFLRRDSMSANQVAGVTLGVVVVTFFLGRFLDGALTWPLPPSLAVELGAAVVAQQTIYQLLGKTSALRALESLGNERG